MTSTLLLRKLKLPRHRKQLLPSRVLGDTVSEARSTPTQWLREQQTP